MQDTASSGTSSCDPPLGNQPASAPHLRPEHGLRLKLVKIQKTFQKALSRTVRLIQMDLPTGCSAAWFGGTESDWICYSGTDQTAMIAMAHTVGHLSLLHCGRIRDSGRFICVDTDVAPRHLLRDFFALTGQDSDGWPCPLFSPEEETAADQAAAALRRRIGSWAEPSVPRQAASRHNFRCLG